MPNRCALFAAVPVSFVIAFNNTTVVRRVSSHSEYLENRPRSREVAWQPVRGDLTMRP